MKTKQSDEYKQYIDKVLIEILDMSYTCDDIKKNDDYFYESFVNGVSPYIAIELFYYYIDT